MCGIAGYLGTAHPPNPEILEAMGRAIETRGPDSWGTWTCKSSGLGLVHRRLAILDLSPAGAQPMVSSSGRYVLSYNGEIYNHLELRGQLESQATNLWQGHSDTETLLAGFDVWGIEQIIEQSVGMFALAVWDREQHVLTLARDRFGEKPLYYGWHRGTFYFASQLKAILAHPQVQPEIDPHQVRTFLGLGYLPNGGSILRDFQKLTPGSLVQIQPQTQDLKVQPYWSVTQAYLDGIANPFPGTQALALDHLEAQLLQSVRGQTLSDVPLGSFLSGGIDSTLVTSLMQAGSTTPIQTFTMGFRVPGYNEANQAQAVAKHLGTHHTELYVEPLDALDLVQDLPSIYDEPLGDVSQLPTILLSRLTRNHVTVALSGDGGDELFGGYNRYLWTHRHWATIQRLPVPLSTLASASLKTLGIILRSSRPKKAEQLDKMARALAASSPTHLYHHLVSPLDQHHNLVGGLSPSVPVFPFETNQALADLSPVQQMNLLDLLHYLPNDVLVKVDRAAMSTSLETRAPFLDHRIAELSFQFPLDWKLSHSQGKLPLRQLLTRYVPDQLIQKPKSGFSVPIATWLAQDLKPWATDLIANHRHLGDQFYNQTRAQELLNHHGTRGRDNSFLLWNLCMFLGWYDRYGR